MICIGAPRLHEYLRLNFKKFGIRSILLDFDHRFHMFYRSSTDAEFLHYNMFNNFFFGGDNAQTQFETFLKQSDYNENCCLFTDPPFGCRTEALAYSIQTISRSYRQINNFQRILPVLWIFPYFMETYVRNSMSEMEMVDYKINYTNHDTYHAGEKGRKQGSPVRMFTNIPLDCLELPRSDGYKYCTHCKRWVAPENVHCKICRKCPSKNGDRYVHCDLCGLCVKPNYKHCANCDRCAQTAAHNCSQYQENLMCAICLTKGHNEAKCHKWFEVCGKKMNNILKIKRKMLKIGKRICLLCFKAGHNERFCSRRAVLLKEYTFMNQTFNFVNNADETEK